VRGVIQHSFKVPTELNTDICGGIMWFAQQGHGILIGRIMKMFWVTRVHPEYLMSENLPHS
jgi:hypothetical protein